MTITIVIDILLENSLRIKNTCAILGLVTVETSINYATIVELDNNPRYPKPLIISSMRL